MTPSLGQFIQKQLDAQGITVKEFARRSGLGLSHAYQLRHDQRRRLSATTFEAIARGLSMTQTELITALDRNGPVDPEDAEVLALFRQVPTDRRPAAKAMLRGLVSRGHHLTRLVSALDRETVNVTNQHGKFGRDNVERVQQKVKRKKYESQSVPTQQSKWGFQPARI